ncbi:MAG: CDP-diacylglycerol--glycerol-3-phosphate 3-phosphatidyltransferase [Candidatus Marinimicrobia bacterium]|nr:CDP-diacylglycerol--glycerol-3-phosphate 3-phosphatidyltransferase [Candidatus Neomarinimicrobiota bacterium]
MGRENRIITIPNILTIIRILLTPVFIICLFSEHPLAKTWALIIFIIASITDAYDGYFARKYDQVTPQGMFLDPLADKILVSSAFISFAIIGLVEYWMVALILFRDLFVTGLRMMMGHKGLKMITSNIAKAKTATQITIIGFILAYLGLKGLKIGLLMPILDFVKQYQLIYYLTFAATLFTVYTGITYLFDNRQVIRKFFS